MAVRFNGAASLYTASTGLPSTLYTMTFWVMLVTDRNDYSTMFTHYAPGSVNEVWLQTNSDGVTPAVYAGLPGTTVQRMTGSAMTTSTWYKFGLVVNGASSVLYQGTAGGTLTAINAVSWLDPVTPAEFRFGASNTTVEQLDGRMAALKVWNSVALTQAEIEAELQQYQPVRLSSLSRYHPWLTTDTTDYSGSGNALTAGTGATTEDGPPIPWGPSPGGRVTITPQTPTADAGKDVFGTAGFEFAIQAVETGAGITARAWTVVNGPAEVATTIGTASLLSWFPTTAGVYELEYRVTNPAGQAYDTVYATVNATGTVVNSASVASATTTLTCNKPTSTAEDDVLLAVQSGDAAEHDEMRAPTGWQPLLEYDVGSGSLHFKAWTLTAGASEPASYDFTQGTGSNGTVTIVAMRGVVEAGVRREIVPDTGTGATRTAPTVEGAVPGSILLCGATTDPGAACTWTPPTGMTEQADLQAGTTNTTHSVASLLNPTDPTGTKDFTLSSTTTAPGGIQWSAVFPMPPDPQRRGANKSMFTVVRTR
jgi:hypothetical protein